MANDDLPPAETHDAAPHSIPERQIALAVAIVFAANIVCLLLLAARAESAPQSRGFFDIGILACVLGVATYGIARFMFLFPFRLLDLLVMVVTLALGMKGAIEGVRWFESERVDATGWPLYAEACMLTGCVLLGGAAMGLRNCRMLNVETPLKRAVVLVFGMLYLPAPITLVLTPFHLLHALLTAHQTSLDSLGWIVALFFSAVITASNSFFSLKTMALKTENATQESAWKNNG
jgi:hypothetical protein